MRALLPLALLALGACATGSARNAAGSEDELAELIRGRTPGAEQRCISPFTNSSARPIGDAVVYQDGGRVWVSRPVGDCPSLRGDPLLIVEVYGSQVCANDRFRTLPRGVSIPGPYCRFGPFVPYDRQP